MFKWSLQLRSMLTLYVYISVVIMLDHLFCHQLWLCPMIFYPNVIHLGTYMLFPIVVSTIWCSTAQSFIDFSSLRKSTNDDLSKLINRNKRKTRRKPELIGFINTSIGSPWKSPSVRLSQSFNLVKIFGYFCLGTWSQ